MKSVFLFLTLVLCWTTNVFASTPSTKSKIAQWIVSCQRDTGAICIYKDQRRILPYDANIAAYGLIEVPGYEDNVKKWIDWYFSHVNDDGTVYDYKIENGVEISLNDCDSEDAYAGTFLSLIWKYYQKTGDFQYLIDRQETLIKIADVIRNLQQEDGLTWAKMNYRVKYMMDNCESYMGLRDYANFCINVLGNPSLFNLYNESAERIRSAILNKWWDEERGGFVWAEHANGVQAKCDWSKFYPDAASQLWTIYHGIIEPKGTIAKKIYGTFNSHHDWASIPGSAPWCSIGYVATMMGDKDRLLVYKEAFKEKFEDKNYPWPWNCREAGCYLLMESRLKPYVVIEKKMDKKYIKPDEPITYTITYRNEGIGTATDVVITEVLPEKVELEMVDSGGLMVNYFIDGSWQDSFSSKATKIRWMIQEILQNDSGSVSFTIKIKNK